MVPVRGLQVAAETIVMLMSFDVWHRQFSNERTCMKYLSSRRWPTGFLCPKCGHDRSYLLSMRRLYECKKCHYQTSATAGTIFHASKAPLTKWFWAIYWVSAKRDVSALQLSELIGVSWRTAQVMIRKLHRVAGSRDRLYQVSTSIELDEALFEPRGKTPAAMVAATAKRTKRTTSTAQAARPSFVGSRTV